MLIEYAAEVRRPIKVKVNDDHEMTAAKYLTGGWKDFLIEDSGLVHLRGGRNTLTIENTVESLPHIRRLILDQIE